MADRDRPKPRLKLPTDRQREAYRLRTVQGLSDRQVAGVLRITRENANRLIREYIRRANALRQEAARSDRCVLLALLGETN